MVIKSLFFTNRIHCMWQKIHFVMITMSKSVCIVGPTLISPPSLPHIFNNFSFVTTPRPLASTKTLNTNNFMTTTLLLHHMLPSYTFIFHCALIESWFTLGIFPSPPIPHTIGLLWYRWQVSTGLAVLDNKSILNYIRQNETII